MQVISHSHIKFVNYSHQDQPCHQQLTTVVSRYNMLQFAQSYVNVNNKKTK